MDPLDIRHSLDYETACEVLTAALKYKQRKKSVSEEYKQRLILKAAHLLKEWKKTSVPSYVCKLLKTTTISRFSLMADVAASPFVVTSPSLSLDNEINGRLR